MFRQNKNRRFWKRSVLKYYSFLSFVVHLRELFSSERLQLIFACGRAPGWHPGDTRAGPIRRVGSLGRDGSPSIADDGLIDQCQPLQIHSPSWSRILGRSAWPDQEMSSVRWGVVGFVDPCFTHLEWFCDPIKHSNPSLIRKLKRFKTLRTLF